MSAEIKFWDSSKRRNWFMARAIVRKVNTRPAMLMEIVEQAEKAWAGDSSKLRSLAIWRKLSALGPEDFERAFLAESPEAEEARDSFPPYLALTPEERAEYIAASRRELATL